MAVAVIFAAAPLCHRASAQSLSPDQYYALTHPSSGPPPIHVDETDGTLTKPLHDFLAAPDPDFAWSIVHPADANGPLQLTVTSQNWRGKDWTHRVRIYQPAKLEFQGAAVIQVMGFAMTYDGLFGQVGANSIGVPFVLVNDVPNQPLDGQIEDDLLASSLTRMFKTGDPTQSLIFPMTRSIVRCMDAVQAWSKDQPGGPITKFIVVGPSKRGWAAWLAAAEDPRVAGLVPLAYNNLRLQRQIRHQMNQWHEFSQFLEPYTQTGIIEDIESPDGARLMAQSDPWSFRKLLTMPKLVVDSTNNGFWTPDAYNIYGDDIPPPTNLPQLVGSLAAWTRRVLEGQKEPLLQADIVRGGRNGAGFTVQVAADEPGGLGLWCAFAKTSDFRNAEWDLIPADPLKQPAPGTTSYRATIPIPDPPEGCTWAGAFVEGSFAGKPQPLRVTSRLYLWPLNGRLTAPFTPDVAITANSDKEAKGAGDPAAR